MLFCGLDSLIQDAVFVALIHWQGMMSWNSDNFDNSAADPQKADRPRRRSKKLGRPKKKIEAKDFEQIIPKLGFSNFQNRSRTVQNDSKYHF